ncbi:DUF2461 domain-containing protein [Deinococcus sp.]|uniref:DUF2461 domain-containing protein n=1 Tax=Deinococcus sp. TaxID=47478 RepID=UPI003B5C1B51
MNQAQLNEFLVELKFNNTKAWFDEHRPRYQMLRAEFVALMGEIIAGVAEFDVSVKDVQPKDTLFRINRDARFSHDKAPYKSTFSAAISPGGRHSDWPLYYLQLGPDEAFVAGGVYAPQPETLRNLRGYIEKHPRKADALLKHPDLLRRFGGLDTAGTLKRFPRGYGEGSALLKYKSFTVAAPLEAVPDAQLRDVIVAQFGVMQPLHAYLRGALAYRAG